MTPTYLFKCLVVVGLVVLGTFFSSAQTATVFGRLTDTLNAPVDAANIAILGTQFGTASDAEGYFSLEVPANQKITISISRLGFSPNSFEIKLKENEKYKMDVVVKSKGNVLTELLYEDKGERGGGMKSIDIINAGIIPTPGGSLESLIKTLPGVVSNNELSSQYNVRGGNYDENLVYINDVEVYRPFLVRSGQQEGLSFINPDLVQGVKFSAGGFAAKYGDKMSSVLDIQYKKPTKFGAGFQATLLGGSAFVEGATKNHRLRFLAGYRYRSNKYVLAATNTKGAYFPVFQDFQALLSYDISDKWEFNVMGNYTSNKYRFIPQTQESSFGTVNAALKLTVYFDGQEVNSFNTTSGAAYAVYKPNDKLRLKFISSVFHSQENETFDVLGQYYLDQLDNNLGSDNLGEKTASLGAGGYLNHARNYLDATIWNVEHKGQNLGKRHEWYWGIKYQHEWIQDRIHEWNYKDSADYSVPQPPSDEVNVYRIIRGKTDLSSGRYMGYVQHNFLFNDSSSSALTLGVRFNYWDLNKQFLVSPRANYSYKPRNWKRDWLFRLSTGIYNQPPFYRELRDLDGKVHTDVKAQQSIHFIVGTDYNFKAWNRPFKFVMEAYYKILNNLVPYEIDNVRIRYYAENTGKGYATGVDFRLNGELAKGAESWISLSLMKTAEDLSNDSYVDDQGVTHYPGYIPRPTDQRLNFNMFFQDYIPKFPSWKVHLNFLFGTGMPFGPPDYNRYKDTLRIPPYRRVDIGFSKQLLGGKKKFGPKNPLKYFKNAWLSLEVFNLLQVQNVISYIWVSDVNGSQWAVPNYLTRRQLNLKLIVNF